MSFIKYIKGVRGEMSHVNWPTSREAGIYTVLVISISALIAAFAGTLDLGLVKAIGFIAG